MPGDQESPDPRKEASPLILLSVPTFGMVHSEFAKSMHFMALPANTSMVWYTPKVLGRSWLPVADARNMTVQVARHHKAKYILFRDDDVVDPRGDGVLRLYQHNVDIAGGFYCMKRMPTEPLIYGTDIKGPMLDWKPGDVMKVGAIGMGFCLIKTSVFDKIPEPWFKTSQFPDPKDPQTEKATRFTEDFYFCMKAREAGLDVWCDTSVSCYHVDSKKNRFYCFDSNYGKYGYYDDDFRFIWMHTAKDFEEAEKAKKELLEKEPYKLALGRAGKDPGYVTVMPYGMDADETGDISNLDWLARKRGFPDVLEAHHVLNKMTWKEAPGVLRNWLNYLKPGGEIRLSVPDFEWAVRNWLELPEEHPEKHKEAMGLLLGTQANPMDTTHSGFTEASLRALASQMPLESFEVQKIQREKDPQPSLLLIGRKQAGLEYKVMEAPAGRKNGETTPEAAEAAVAALQKGEAQ